METTESTPAFLFLREKPTDLLLHPPLASSLQNLETSLLLVTMKRYPHALVACASGIESALKAAFDVPADEKTSFDSLLKDAYDDASIKAMFTADDLSRFRRKRNEIVHYGFSPKDDAISAELLLNTGYGLLSLCYERYFSYSLHTRVGKYGGLLPDIDRHLHVAWAVFKRVKSEPNLDVTYCFMTLAQKIRWSIQDWMMADWQRRALILAEANEAFEDQKQQSDYLKRVLKHSWKFDCPICGTDEGLVCELDELSLVENRIGLARGACVGCGLVVPSGCPFLLDELCAEDIRNAAPRILAEYGFES